MKLQELFEIHDEELVEGVLQNAIAAAGFVLASVSPSAMRDGQVPSTPDAKPAIQQVQHKTGPNISQLVTVAASKYKVNPRVVQQVVASAIKHAHTDFPTAKDLLAVIGVESSFNPDAKSQLKTDPARGLMQIRPGVWDLPETSFKTIDSQIQTGADILHKYYIKLGSREAALHAYNIGITNYKRGTGTNPRYVPKINKEKSLYDDI